MDVLDGIANLPPQLLLIKLHLHQERILSETDTYLHNPRMHNSMLYREEVLCQHYHVTDEILAQ